MRFPMAATLVPASMPITVQEASRVARKIAQQGQWALHFATGGRVREPRLSWPNYEFLRRPPIIRQLVSELAAPLWDLRALNAWVRQIESGRIREEMLGSAEFVGRMLTVDRMLR
jgi:hypothetical protein